MKQKNLKKPKTLANKKSMKVDIKGEVTIIISVIVAIFLIFSIWFSIGGIIGNMTKQATKGLFGYIAYTVPLIIIGVGICALTQKNNHLKLKLWVLGLLPAILASLWHTMYIIGNNTAYGIENLYANGTLGNGGGVIGGVIAEPIFALLGSVVTMLIFIALILIMLMLLFEISIVSLFKNIWKYIATTFKDLAHSVKECNVDRQPTEKEMSMEEYLWKKADTEEIVISDPLNQNTYVEEATKVHQHIEYADDEQGKIADEPHDNTFEQDQLIIEQRPHKEYIYPMVELLEKGPSVTGAGKIEQLKANATRLIEILSSYGIDAKVTNITRGSSVTRYEILPAPGIKVSKITALDQDIALRLPASNVRMEVMSGSIGVEVSNTDIQAVFTRGIIESEEFKSNSSKLAIALGVDIEGKTVIIDLAKAPHLLIAGQTGSGKSVCVNTIITSLLFKSSPEEVRLVMIDPKVVELGMYAGIPHLLVPIVTDPRKAAGALCWAVSEMEDRYKKFAENTVKDLAGYNRKMREQGCETLPQIVIIIDELADLMMVAPGEVQDYICRIAQKARAAGMHLVVATQRPSVDVITGLIKANIPSRISFSVTSQIDSRTILDQAGAEKLMGKGDMLLMFTGSSKIRRVQGAFITDKDIENVVGFIKDQQLCEYNENVLDSIEQNVTVEVSNEDKKEEDVLLDDAADLAFELGQISTSMIQRRLSVGYARAGRLLDLLAAKKVISAYDGTNKPRQLTMSRQEYHEMRNS